MESIKILFVNERPFNPIVGGIERVTDVLTKSLLSKGYTIYYLCGKVEELKDVLNYDFPVPVYQLPEYGLFNSVTNLQFYEDLLNRLEIDIVINQRGLNGGFNRMLTIGGVKKISVIHSKPNAQINHNIARLLLFSNEFKEQLKKYIKICFYPLFYVRAINKAKKMLKKAYRELVQYSDAVVLLSDNDKDEFLSNGVNLENKILCGIPNPNTFSIDESCKIKDKEKSILYVGRFDQFEKNILCLIKIWKSLFLDYPDWRLVLVGDGPDKERILKYIQKHQIENVFIEGVQRNVDKYYRKASFVCLTSFYEGWGMSLTEGMSYGCIPCTFNNYGAARDIIDDGVNGCLIKAFDVREYAIRLSELLKDDVKRYKMSQAAFEKVKEFSIENIVEKWELLFSEIDKKETLCI